MDPSKPEIKAGTTLRLKNPLPITGRSHPPTSIIHHSSRALEKNFQKSKALIRPTVWLLSDIQSLPIIFPQPETFQSNLQLPDISRKEESDPLISTPMEPEEEMMKSWQEELLRTPESSTCCLPKLDLKPLTFPMEKSWTSVMLLSNIRKKDIKLSFSQVQNMVQDHQEIGLLKDPIFSELKPLSLKVSKEFTDPTSSEWVSCLWNSRLDKTPNHLVILSLILGLSGKEKFDIDLKGGNLSVNEELIVKTDDGKTFKAKIRLDTDVEI